MSENDNANAPEMVYFRRKAMFSYMTMDIERSTDKHVNKEFDDDYEYVLKSTTDKQLNETVESLSTYIDHLHEHYRVVKNKRIEEIVKPIAEEKEGIMKSVAGQYSMAKLVNEEWVMNYIVALEKALTETLALVDKLLDKKI